MEKFINEPGILSKSDKMFSDRITDVPRSFIREILKVAISPDVISFAGGLPNRELFPVENLKQSAIKVFDNMGRDALQYSNSEGFMPLREYISHYYQSKHSIQVHPDNILITSGSQQGLDLLGKVLLNQNDEVIIEEPGYLGAIQAFSLYRPKFRPVPLQNVGIDTDVLKKVLSTANPKLMYVVPEFQNPSGISYTLETRLKIVDIIKSRRCYIVEDNPYIDLRFEGTGSGSFYSFLPERTVLLGTFSKTAVPGLRLGWIIAPDELMDKLIIAKQASDLHTNIFTQMLLFRYLSDNDINSHISKIITVYGRQRNAMINAIEKHFPPDIRFTRPQGGMFLWVTLPDFLSSMDLFNMAIEKKVAFVPGNPFYTDRKETYSTLRLNFSCSDENTILIGIKRMSEAIHQLLKKPIDS